MTLGLMILAVAVIAWLWGFSAGVNTGKGNTIVRDDKRRD